MKGFKPGQSQRTPSQRPSPSSGRTSVQRPISTARLHEETRDGWSDVPFDQQAAFAPDNPDESTFSEYATGRLIREATSLNRLGELMEGMPEPLGPKNASLALEKFALLGTSVPSGSAHAMRVVGGPEHVLAICKGVGGAPEARSPHVAVASRSLWALAELAKVSFLDGTTLIDRQAPEVQAFLTQSVATCDPQQCNARDACAMLWALGVLQPRLTPEIAAFVGDLVDAVQSSVESPLLQLRDWADMLWAIATLAGQAQGNAFGPYSQHNAAAVLQKGHPLAVATHEHRAGPLSERRVSGTVRPEDAHPPGAGSAPSWDDALSGAAASMVHQTSSAIGYLSASDPARFKRLSADTVVSLLTSFAVLGIRRQDFDGPQLLCQLSTRRMRSGHMQALARPPQLAAAAAAASAIRASARVESTPAEGDWAERFCGAIDAAMCKHLASVHLRMSHDAAPQSAWSRGRARGAAPEGEGAEERAQRAGLEALSESVRHIEAQVGVPGDSAQDREQQQAAARRADEYHELAELCVHTSSVAQSLAACGMRPSVTLGLAVQPMIGALLERGGELGECSPGMSQLLSGVRGAEWPEREAQAAVTREALQQLGGITCMPAAQ